jgi:hypothetical protein
MEHLSNIDESHRTNVHCAIILIFCPAKTPVEFAFKGPMGV